MKTFLAVYTGTPDSMEKWDDLSETERSEHDRAGIAAWHAWAEKHESIIVDMGSPHVY